MCYVKHIDRYMLQQTDIGLILSPAERKKSAYPGHVFCVRRPHFSFSTIEMANQRGSIRYKTYKQAVSTTLYRCCSSHSQHIRWFRRKITFNLHTWTAWDPSDGDDVTTFLKCIPPGATLHHGLSLEGHTVHVELHLWKLFGGAYAINRIYLGRATSGKFDV